MVINMKLASIFTDHMVLQAGKPIKIFGEGKGKITAEFLGERKEYTSNEENWCISYPQAEYGGPYEMKITLNDEKIVLRDIYIGEVWLACGQSNMELVLYKTEYGFEEAQHCQNNMIRFFTVPRRTKSDVPLCGWHSEKVRGEDTLWQMCNEESALHFSAIGYYAAKELCQKLGIAIGVISCNWGGMGIETFIGRKYFKEAECLKEALENYNKMLEELDWKEYNKMYSDGVRQWEDFYNSINYSEVEEVRRKGVRANVGMPETPNPGLPYGPYLEWMPGALYDSMLSRIAPFGVKGMFWYQGESNRSENYIQKYLLFMKCMRETFENEDMQFYAIELASFSNWWSDESQETDNRFVTGNNWAFTREQQQRATEVKKNNYLVTSMELGDIYDIHPIQKKELAHRLSMKVLKYSYGFDIYADQPLFRSVEFKASKAYIKLDNADGLYCKFPDGVKMYMADERRELKRAKVKIENDGLILSCDEIKNPILVRYAFDYCYVGCHIYNKAGLPLAPFRTDNDELI